MPPSPAPPRRRWFQLGLRGLMVAVLVVGGGAGWVAHVIRTQRAAIAAVRASGGSLRFDWSGRVVTQPGPDGRPRRVAPTGPDVNPWLLRWLGEELFQQVTSVTFEAPVTPEAGAALESFAHLETLRFEQVEPISFDLARLRGLRRLQHLTLRPSAVDDTALGQITQLNALQSLGIMGTTTLPDSPATDVGFARLTRLPNLVSLWVANCPRLTDDGAARMVEGMPRLRRLWMSTPLSSVAAFLPALVRRHPDLTELSINRSEVRDEDLRRVARLSQLKMLYLADTKIIDAGLVDLAPLNHLETLSLHSTRVTDGGLAQLVPLPNLKALVLNQTDVIDAGLPALARLPSLEKLHLWDLPITDAGVLALTGAPHLKTVTLVGTRVTPEGVAALRRAAPRLKAVDIGPTPGLRRIPPAPTPAPAPKGK